MKRGNNAHLISRPCLFLFLKHTSDFDIFDTAKVEEYIFNIFQCLSVIFPAV